jgi:hypothetical protein
MAVPIRILLALAVVTTLAAQQAKPNFSGHWAIDTAASDLGGTGVGWFGNDLQVTQDATSITFGAAGSGPGTGSSTYSLDGKVARRKVGTNTREDSARWENDHLLLIDRQIPPGSDVAPPAAISRTATVHIATDGALIVDVTVSPPQTRTRFATRSVYRKQK